MTAPQIARRVFDALRISPEFGAYAVPRSHPDYYWLFQQMLAETDAGPHAHLIVFRALDLISDLDGEFDDPTDLYEAVLDAHIDLTSSRTSDLLEWLKHPEHLNVVERMIERGERYGSLVSTITQAQAEASRAIVHQVCCVLVGAAMSEEAAA